MIDHLPTNRRVQRKPAQINADFRRCREWAHEAAQPSLDIVDPAIGKYVLT
jgi:hypothetical protein